MKMVKVVVGLMGSSPQGGSAKLSGPDQLRPLLAILKNHQIREIDTARAYNAGQNEQDLGALPSARADFAIATKAPGFSPGSLAYERVKAKCDESRAALQQDRLGLYYFHGPDPTTPLEDSCRAIHELHQEGKITTFGISNYSTAQVEQIHALCAEHGWIAPSVYQGMYNPIMRALESGLLATLRKHKMAFYAFSPLAGGFFSKTSAQLRAPAEGSRIDQMAHFKNMFVSDESLALHDRLAAVCGADGDGVSMKEATLRWLLHHSALDAEDAVILGGSSPEQLEENLKACEGGPLPAKVVECFDSLWDEYKKTGNVPSSI